MKNDMTSVWQTWRSVSAALAGIVLMAGAGCICINIELGPHQVGSPGSPGSPPDSAPPSGGNFMPVQSVISGPAGNTTLCGQQISKKHVNFYPPSQVPNPGENGFRGFLFNTNTSQIISNNTYVLQWIVDMNNLGCGTPVAGSTTDVSFPVTAGLSYKMTAHFKPGQVPAGNPKIVLNGAWVVQ